jgi:hypothetical protein
VTHCIIIPVEWNQPLRRAELVGLPDFQRAIGGWIEYVAVNEELALLVHEEGRVKHSPINRRATLLRRLYHPASRNAPAVVGSAVLIGPPNDEEFGDVPKEMERLLIESRRFVVRATQGDSQIKSTTFDSFWDASQVAIVADLTEELADVEVVAFE